MAIAYSLPTVDQLFFQPLTGLVALSPRTRECPGVSDEAWLRLGVQRVIEPVVSGRGFLQEHGPRFEQAPSNGTYFAALRSMRRSNLIRDISRTVTTQANKQLPDRLADIPELEGYECFAMDGHWHKAAAHDPKHKEQRMAVGHFYSLDLRRHALRHMATGRGLHEHDMSVLKRLKPKGLRQDVPKGQRTLIVYDKACIDFDYWKRCRQECAVYFLSRAKEDMVYDCVGETEWDQSDWRNHGVTADLKIKTREGHLMRIVFYTDPRTGESYEFLTNEMDLPPGVIVELYRQRWAVEKVFDQLKNKLHEKKAWGSSPEAKETQAHFLTITHNLMLIYEARLEQEHGIKNEAEDERRAKRVEESVEKCRIAGKPISELLERVQRATQRSVKFVRWIRHAIRDGLAEATAVPRLRLLYAQL
jgi:hypothetical protein